MGETIEIIDEEITIELAQEIQKRLKTNALLIIPISIFVIFDIAFILIANLVTDFNFSFNNNIVAITAGIIYFSGLIVVVVCCSYYITNLIKIRKYTLAPDTKKTFTSLELIITLIVILKAGKIFYTVYSAFVFNLTFHDLEAEILLIPLLVVFSELVKALVSKTKEKRITKQLIFYIVGTILIIISQAVLATLYFTNRTNVELTQIISIVVLSQQLIVVIPGIYFGVRFWYWAKTSEINPEVIDKTRRIDEPETEIEKVKWATKEEEES